MCRCEELYLRKNIYYAIYFTEVSFSYILFLSKQEPNGEILLFEAEQKEICTGKVCFEKKKKKSVQFYNTCY